MMRINNKLSRVMIVMGMVIFSCSIGHTQIQTDLFKFSDKSPSHLNDQNDNFVQNFMNTIKTLIGSNRKFRDQARENKYKMREIRAKARDVQANIKRQQRDNKAKINEVQANNRRQQRDNKAKLREARARQREQMRFMRDRLRR